MMLRRDDGAVGRAARDVTGVCDAAVPLRRTGRMLGRASP